MMVEEGDVTDVFGLTREQRGYSDGADPWKEERHS